jgi:hypothetical protein
MAQSVEISCIRKTDRTDPHERISYVGGVNEDLVETGFIQGRNVTPTESSTNQSKALQLLNAIYVKTHNRTDSVFISELETGLLEEDLKAAWRYLKDRRLIDTFNIAYTARINGRGIDAVENAHRHPDQTSSNFPSVTYNVVNNTVNVDTMNSSPFQQAGVQSKQHQMVNCSTQDLIDLKRMVNELAIHLRTRLIVLKPPERREPWENCTQRITICHPPGRRRRKLPGSDRRHMNRPIPSASCAHRTCSLGKASR